MIIEQIKFVYLYCVSKYYSVLEYLTKCKQQFVMKSFMLITLFVGLAIAKNATTFYGKCGVFGDQELFK